MPSVIGFDLAVIESCWRGEECAAYTDVYPTGAARRARGIRLPCERARRVTFEFRDGIAYVLEYEDYH